MAVQPLMRICSRMGCGGVANDRLIQCHSHGFLSSAERYCLIFFLSYSSCGSNLGKAGKASSSEEHCHELHSLLEVSVVNGCPTPDLGSIHHLELRHETCPFVFLAVMA